MIFTAMRYKLLLSYMGINYSGWQKQPGAKTVQQTIEEAFSTVLREQIEVVGCGRTDQGVHARGYCAHFDVKGDISDVFKIVYQVNAILPTDIAIWSCLPTHDDFHARFDAIERSYTYSMHFVKDPFIHQQSYYLNTQMELNQRAMQDVADLIMLSNEFSIFCKTGADNKNFKCSIKHSEWNFGKKHASYTISANRFLRGMVRLIVGASLNVGLGKFSVETVRESLISQKPLPLQWSVPPEGLCFQYAIYPPSPSKEGWIAYPNGNKE